jgi:hypothetical protein
MLRTGLWVFVVGRWHRFIADVEGRSDMPKDGYIAFRTTRDVKEALQEEAEKDFRTLSQQCEMIVIEWLRLKEEEDDAE